LWNRAPENANLAARFIASRAELAEAQRSFFENLRMAISYWLSAFSQKVENPRSHCAL
jgi:hypothetical protein